MKIINNILVQKDPDTIELRAYLGQVIGFIDKRDFIQLSFIIENYILNEFNIETDIFDFILNDLEIEQIKKILTKFDLLPEKIYFFTTDKDCYTEFYFDNIVVDSLNNLTIGKNSNDDDLNDNHSNHNILNDDDFMEDNRFTPSDIPNIYNKIHQLSPENDLIVMEKIPGFCYEIYDTKGNNLSNQFIEVIDSFKSSESLYLDSYRFASVNLGENNKILIKLGGRIENWLLFERYNGEIKLIEFSNTNTYSLPKDFKYLDSTEVIQNYIR